MTQARREILCDEEAVYHCISRCVRRAYLCGYDALTGRSFDHRKVWLRDRLVFLSEIFTIDVLAYALMSTHQHTMLRTRPDLLDSLSNEDVARRWMRLYPASKDVELNEVAVKALMLNKARLMRLRKRLGSISWFMKSVNEHMARRANREDKCKGRFWEGRFWCQRLEDEAAVFSCAVYVDLNPIRAKVAKTPEESEFTSVFERIKAEQIKKQKDLWLCPIENTETRKGFLPVTYEEYLNVLDESGRILVKGKRGAIPQSLAPILERLSIKPDTWDTTMQHFGKWFSRIVGASDSMHRAKRSLGKTWLKGLRAAKFAFK